MPDRPTPRRRADAPPPPRRLRRSAGRTPPPPPPPPPPYDEPLAVDEPPEQTAGLPIAGLVLLLVSVLLSLASWVLFDRGQPGTPLFPDLRPDYGFTSTVTVYLPDSAPVTGGMHNVSYTQLVLPGDERAVVQDLDLDLRLAKAPTRPVWVIVEFRGGSRMDLPESGGRPAETVELGDRQLVLLDIGPPAGGVTSVAGRMRIPPLSTENSRMSFASPTVGLQKVCTGLDALTAPGSLAGLTFNRWAAVAEGCPDTDVSRQTFIVLPTGNSPLRVDYVDVDPVEAGSSPVFRWKAEGKRATLRVRSSFVDINGEAKAQRQLFLCGIAVGLATVCAPYAIQSLVVYAARRRTRSRRRQPR